MYRTAVMLLQGNREITLTIPPELSEAEYQDLLMWIDIQHIGMVTISSAPPEPAERED